MRALYSLLLWLLQPLVRRKLARRARAEPGYAHAVEQRFGDYSQAAAVQAGPPLVWLHAVSLGETRAAGILLAHLRVRYPRLRVLLTHGTATGWEQGRALLRAGDVQAWQPWDTPGAVSAFLKHFQPRLGLLMETEVWPNLVAGCAAGGIPLCLLNARLSDKSLRQALRLRWLAQPAYQALSAVWAQSADDARRLRQLGAPVGDVSGNLKFDAQPDAAQLACARRWRARPARPLVLFASSREGEEAQLLDQLLLLAPAQRESVQWLIVPRHPQRFAEVAALVQARGLSLSRRSEWPAEPADSRPVAESQALAATPLPTRPLAASVWLGDSMGEMAFYFGLADVALLGGSCAPLGGQNLIEAAACSCPVVLGPHTFNFAEATTQALQAQAAVRVDDLAAAVARALALVQDPVALARARQCALDWSQAHRGAADRTVQALAPYLAALEA